MFRDNARLKVTPSGNETMLHGRVSGSAATNPRPRVKRAAIRRSRPEQARINGRSREGVRVRALQRQFRAEIGEEADNAVVALAVRDASELTMLAEMQRAALIRGENVDLSNLLRLEGVARRAIAFMRQLARGGSWRSAAHADARRTPRHLCR